MTLEPHGDLDAGWSSICARSPLRCQRRRSVLHQAARRSTCLSLQAQTGSLRLRNRTTMRGCMSHDCRVSCGGRYIIFMRSQVFKLSIVLCPVLFVRATKGKGKTAPRRLRQTSGSARRRARSFEHDPCHSPRFDLTANGKAGYEPGTQMRIRCCPAMGNGSDAPGGRRQAGRGKTAPAKSCPRLGRKLRPANPGHLLSRTVPPC